MLAAWFLATVAVFVKSSVNNTTPHECISCSSWRGATLDRPRLSKADRWAEHQCAVNLVVKTGKFKVSRRVDSSASENCGTEDEEVVAAPAEAVRSAAERTAAACRRQTLARWRYAVNASRATHKAAMVAKLEETHYWRALTKYLQGMPQVEPRDPDLERQINLLSIPGRGILPDINIAVFEEMLFAMEAIFSSAAVPKWTEPNIKIPLTDVLVAFRESKAPDETQHYWKEWRLATGRKLRRLYEQYIEFVSLTAIKNGFADGGEMWLREFEGWDTLEWLGGEWADLELVYSHLHAFARCALRRRFGDAALGEDPALPLPAHLTGDLWASHWKNLYSVLKPFNDCPEPLLTTKITVSRMAAECEKFFGSLGFPPLDESVWRNSVLEQQIGQSMSCVPTAWDMHDGKDFRISMCATGTLHDLISLHEQVTHVHYFMQYSQLSFSYRRPPIPGFSLGLAGTILLSIQSPTHTEMLEEESLLVRRHVNTTESDLNFLMSQALNSLVSLPFSYIVEKWRYDIFRGEIAVDSYNAHWWQLREQYQGLRPGCNISEEDLDPASIPQVALNQPYIQRYVGTLVQFQAHEALCRRCGLLEGEVPLHRCSLRGSLCAGQAIMRAMSMGAQASWRDTLAALTGSGTLRSSAIRSYFSPLLKWLHQANSAKNSHPGWVSL